MKFENVVRECRCLTCGHTIAKQEMAYVIHMHMSQHNGRRKYICCACMEHMYKDLRNLAYLGGVKIQK